MEREAPKTGSARPPLGAGGAAVGVRHLQRWLPALSGCFYQAVSKLVIRLFFKGS